MRPPHPAPLVIIGLDGAGFNLLDPMMTRGQLPHLHRLASTGLRTDLLSTVPAATLPAWTSFMTASSPSVHGVTDIFMREGYGLVPSNGTFRAIPTFLARLAAAGYTVASLGVPGTYPPEPLENGVCVAGFDAPGASEAGPKAIWPKDYAPRLERLGGWRYATFNEHARGPQRLQRAVRALLDDIAKKERIVLDLYKSRSWDVFFVHLQASDTAAHHLWHTYDRRSPRHSAAIASEALLSIYQRLDTLIGRLHMQLPANARVMVVSDHGMGGASTTAVYLNRWLAGQGLLVFNHGARHRVRRLQGRVLRRTIGALPPRLLGSLVRHAPPKLIRHALHTARGTAVDMDASRAFSDELDYAPAIWINARERFANGIVGKEDVLPLSEHLRDELLRLRCPVTGSPVVERVRLRNELSVGPHRDRFPDLLIEPAWPDGYRPSFLNSDGPGRAVAVIPPERFTAPKGAGMPGVHRREGIFIVSGPGLPITDIPALGIAQAGACVYALMGMELPAEADAHLPAYLREMVETAATRQAGEHDASPGEPYSDGENLQLTQRLESLGYLS